MLRQRFTAEQIIGKLREVEVLVGQGTTVLPLHWTVRPLDPRLRPSQRLCEQCLSWCSHGGPCPFLGCRLFSFHQDGRRARRL